MYFHTPNSDYEDFPQKFDDFVLELPCGDKQLERYLKQLADKGFTILHSKQEADFIQIIIFENNIGHNLERYLKQLADKGFTILHSSQEADFIQIIIFNNSIGKKLRTDETI